MSNSRVTIIGGTGFVGRQLVYRLATRFDNVQVLTRRSARVRAFMVLSNVHVIETDVHDTDALQSAINNSDLVINLVGILNESGSSGKNSFDAAHDELTGKIVAACQKQGIRRYLHMSSLSADAENGSSAYLRSKGRAEQHVRNASDDLAWTIFRPSVIFGDEDAFFNRFSALLAAMPAFPLACPNSRLAPVHVGDVCDVLLDAIDNPVSFGETISLCGPETYTLRELVEYTATTSGLNRKIIGLPDWAAKLQARVMEWVPGKPFSRDNYLSLQTDSICPDECPKQTTSIGSVVPGYLGNLTVQAKIQSQRRMARR